MILYRPGKPPTFADPYANLTLSHKITPKSAGYHFFRPKKSLRVTYAHQSFRCSFASFWGSRRRTLRRSPGWRASVRNQETVDDVATGQLGAKLF